MDAEKRCAEHFDSEWKRRNVKGYEVLLDLHQNSDIECFANSRKYVEGVFFVESEVSQLETALKCTKSFLNIAYNVGNNCHSITVFSDGDYMFARDTNQKNVYLLSGGLGNIGTLRDSVLYVLKKDF